MITDYHIFASQEFSVHSAPNKPLADLITKTQLDKLCFMIDCRCE